MVSKHFEEENIFLNNDFSCSSENDASEDEEWISEFDNRKAYRSGGGCLPNLIRNDLKGVRSGGPLMDNEKAGATAGATATVGPEKLKCQSCKKDTRKLYSPKWFGCKPPGCYKTTCSSCFSGQQCTKCKKPRKRGCEIDKDKTPEKKAEKEKLIVWKSGDPAPTQ